MRGLSVPSSLLEEMRGYARESYPEECCGFLFSSADRVELSPRPIGSVALAPNERVEERHRRFVISAEQLREAERRAIERGEVVCGFFHSHPDQPARPSRFDQDHAWPWYSYVILSVTAGDPSPEVGAFQLDPDRGEFVRVALATETTPPSVASGGA